MQLFNGKGIKDQEVLSVLYKQKSDDIRSSRCKDKEEYIKIRRHLCWIDFEDIRSQDTTRILE